MNNDIQKMGINELYSFKDKVINSLLETSEKLAIYDEIDKREAMLNRDTAFANEELEDDFNDFFS